MRPAHIRVEQGEIVAIQSVKEHLQNVAKYTGIYAGKIGLRACGELIGWLHDIGKLTVAFETYINRASMQPNSYQKGPDHSTAGAVWISELAQSKKDAIAALTGQLIAIIIMGHHGGLGDIIDLNAELPYIKRLNKLTEDAEWQKQYEEVLQQLNQEVDVEKLKQLFVNACEEMEHLFKQMKTNGRNATNANQTLKYELGVLCKYLYSCLVDADRYDTACFMDGEALKKTTDPNELWQTLSERFETRLKTYKGDTCINQLRQQISNACYENAKKPAGIYTLNCPTGAGKTMASLRFALNHAKAWGKERIFYIIPFITITEQNAAEIKKMLQNEPTDPLIEQSILELHSAKEEEISAEELKSNELLAERMSQPLIFTTMVRFLNVFFESGTKNIRGAHHFANAIIIFDEIQTISPKCIGLFNGLINFLVNYCKATIVLSTATQPLLDHTPNEIPKLLVNQKAELSGCTVEMYAAFKRTQIIDMTQGPAQSVAEIGEFIWQEVQRSGNTLIVFNTKSAVTTLYDQIQMYYGERLEEENIKIYVLTTNLYAQHRKQKIEAIRLALQANQKLIVISTQLIEAGVDISFKSVFRALAGLDSVIQCAGRCNRHGELGVGQLGKVYIVHPDFEKLGSLKDIKRGKAALQEVLDVFRNYPIEVGGEIDSLKAISSYFGKYYKLQKDEMAYPITTHDLRHYELYHLLSYEGRVFSEAYKQYKLTNDKDLRYESRLIITQSFKTAAKYFNAIDQKGKSVVVAHGEGKQLITELLSMKRYGEMTHLLKKLQMYTVNISEGMFKALGNAIQYYETYGIYVLNEDYYDEVFGVSTRLSTMTFYNF